MDYSQSLFDTNYHRRPLRRWGITADVTAQTKHTRNCNRLRFRILVVDDDRDIAESTGLLLRSRDTRSTRRPVPKRP
jgi:peroxiredoxin